MAEVLVIGKKISEMGLVNEITGEEKIPTSALGDKAVTTGQLLTYVNNNGVAQWGRIGGDIANQVDLQNQFTQERDTLKSYTQEQVSQQQVALQEHIDATNEVFEYTRENGSALPYKEGIAYEDGAVVVKDGVLQQWKDGEWKSVVAASLSDTIQTFNTPEAGVDPVTGVADGAYFNVRSSSDDAYIDEYQNIGGVPTPSGKSYPSSVYVHALKEAIINPETGKADAKKVFDGAENQHEINSRLSQLVITPEYFGAVAGEADSSAALNAAILFCSVNNYVLDGKGKKYNANNLVLKDNTHIKRISIDGNLYDTMNSVITTDYGMLTPLKNVTLDTVYIDGKRELHTNVGSTMDGGRCAVLIRRPIDGLRIINSKLNNAVTDGLMLFPVDWMITAENWTHFVKNVTIENSEMFWNGRWGISADSAKHMTLRNVKGKFNGLDVAGGGDYTTGKSARLLNGKKYGGGLDVEEYHGFAYSKDINIINCDMTENASTGLLFERTGEISGTTEITITGGNFDSGTSVDSSGRSIAISAYSDTGAISAYKVTISQPNLNNGDLYLRKCQYADVSQLLNLNVIHIDQSVVIADKVYNFVYDQPSNSNFRSGIREGKDDFLGRNNAESTVWLHTENKVEAISNLKIRAGGLNLGGIRFQKSQPAGSTGVSVEFMNGEDPILGVTQYGTIFPAVGSVSTLGLQHRRFQKAWLDNINVGALAVFSDNSAAISGGLVAGDFYRTSTGQVMVVF